MEDILNGKINDNKLEKYVKKINDIEKDLNKSKKGEKINKLKNYIKKVKNSVYEKDKGRVRTDEAKSFEDQKGKDKGRVRTDEAKSFADQKGKGYVDLPILLYKLNINSSKELISNIEQLINNLYNNKQITKQVYNILNKAIAYKNDS